MTMLLGQLPSISRVYTPSRQRLTISRFGPSNSEIKAKRPLTMVASGAGPRGSSEYHEDGLLSAFGAGPGPLATMALQAALERIRSAADGLQATFACGGSIECSQPARIFYWDNDGNCQSEVRLLCLNLQHGCLREGSFKESFWLNLTRIVRDQVWMPMQHKALELPKQGADASALGDLVSACSAATFGRSNPNNPRGRLHALENKGVLHTQRYAE